MTIYIEFWSLMLALAIPGGIAVATFGAMLMDVSELSPYIIILGYLIAAVALVSFIFRVGFLMGAGS